MAGSIRESPEDSELQRSTEILIQDQVQEQVGRHAEGDEALGSGSMMEGGFRPVSSLTSRSDVMRARFQDLTHRELEVLAKLSRGSPNKIIAHELGICQGTVKIHVRHIMQKLRASNRTQVSFMVISDALRHLD